MSIAYQIYLDGTQVSTNPTTTARGIGYAIFDSVNQTLSYSIRIIGLDFGNIFDSGSAETVTPGDDVTNAHIHSGARGSNGGVAFDFLNDDDLQAVHHTTGSLTDGSRTISGLWETTDARSISGFTTVLGTATPGSDVGLYFNIHTNDNPGGEIRGQLVASAGENDDTVNGTAEAETLFGLGGNDQIIGKEGNDTLYGGNGNDTLSGDAGADSMVGGLGDDLFFVDDLGDKVVEAAGEGSDTVSSSVNYVLGDNIEGLALNGVGLQGTGNALNNLITGDNGDNALIGLDGDDSLYGQGGNDTLFGGAGNDILAANAGDVTIFGGDGDDTAYGGSDKGTIDLGDGVDRYYGGVGSDHVEAGAGNDYIRGGGGTDDIFGGDGNDDLNGEDGDDFLFGGADNDRLFGGLGNDSMFGGLGNDQYYLDGLGDSISEGANEGFDYIYAGFDYVLGDNFEGLSLSGDGLTGTGNALDNYIRGSVGADSLTGLDGDDSLFGSDGNDTILGGDGNDHIEVGLGDNLVYGGAGVDTVFGNEGTNTVDLGDGDDLFYGGNGTNIVAGGSGDDVMYGKDIGNQMSGDSGNDVLYGGAAGDSLSGGDNDDGLSGFGGDDTLSGGAGNDGLYAGDGNDTLYGGAGDDTVYGHDGDDVVGFGVASTTITVERVTDGLQITSTEGVDYIRNDVESFAFSDQALTYAQVDALAPAEPQDMFFLIQFDGAQAGTGSTASGSGYAVYTASTNSMFYQINISGLDFGNLFDDGVMQTIDTADDVTNAHIHNAARGSNGGVAFAFLNDTSLFEFKFADGSRRLQGTWNDADADKITPFKTDLGFATIGEDAPLYFNIHTSGFPAGEIRGQFVATANDEDNIVNGTDDDEFLDGRRGNDEIFGNGGNDQLAGGGGQDTIYGGAGHDTFFQTQFGSTGLKYGGDGSDSFLNLGANDTAHGGADSDTYYLDDANATIVELADEGNDAVRTNLLATTLGANLETLILTGAASHTGIGNELANTILGNQSANATVGKTLSGLGGNDTINGGNADDLIDGGDGNDNLTGGAGADQLNGGAGDDLLISGGGDTVDGGTGEDTAIIGFNLADVTARASGSDLLITTSEGDSTYRNVEKFSFLDRNVLLAELITIRPATAGDDSIDGTAGDDSIKGLEGNDTINGLDGDDTIEGNEGDDSLDGGNGNDLLTGFAGKDIILGGNGNDTLRGFFDDDTLYGGFGEDRMDGGQGADRMQGGQNGDYYLVNHVDDVVIEVAGHVGIDRVASGVSYSIEATHVETLILGGPNSTNGTGNGLNNYMLGNGSDNILRGMGGNDRIEAAGGNDTLYGGAGNDTLNGGPGSDLIYVEDAGDRVAESNRWAGVDTVSSGVDFRLGNAHVEDLILTGTARIGAGNGLANRITGNDGDNILDGGKNVDTLTGGLGDDTYLIRAPGDNAVERAGEGIDTVKAFRAYAMDAHIEKLFLQTLRNAAGEGVTGINGIGNDIANTIVGNPFDNVIIGRGGLDTLKGQNGADTFVFDRAISADNVDRIIDFNTNSVDEGDILLMKGSVFGGLAAGILANSAFAASAQATTADHRFLFDQSRGELWFDADGTGSGLRQLVATFEQGATVTASDIEIF